MNLLTLRKIVCISIGVLVAGAGIAHFTNADFFTKLVPETLQAHRGAVNAVTGVIQAAMGLCFLVPMLRAVARWSTIVLLVVTLPAAIGQVIHPESIEAVGLMPALAVVRVVAQLLMIGLIWWATKPDASRQANA